MAYCAQCRIGTVDQAGLCVLCGASAVLAKGWRRVAESVAGALGAAWNPLALVLGAFVCLLVTYALLVRAGIGQQAVVGLRAMPRFGAAAALATLRADPAGGFLRLLAPAILQAIIFAIVLMTLLYLSRRRRSPRPPDSEDEHSLGALGA